MRDLEQRARDAFNAVYGERSAGPSIYYDGGCPRVGNFHIEAMCRALEAHDATKAEFEAFRREASEAVKAVKARSGPRAWEAVIEHLTRFILPEPVDPLLIEAREICSQMHHAQLPHIYDEYRAGQRDTDDDVQLALAALKRGLTITEQQP